MEITNKIFQLYNNYGSKDYIGESVTQIEHMVQAAMLAEEDNSSVELVLASLFHDIGNLVGFDDEKMGEYGIMNHEKKGADFLRNLGFNENIPLLIENHVIAKRYLARDPEYYNNLSEASKQTLIYQGGPMDDTDADNYQNLPNFDSYIKIRRYDDQAKNTNITIKSLNYYRDMCYNYLIKHQ